MNTKKPLTVRIALFSARHRWWVAGLWIFLMINLVAVGGAIPASNQPYDQFGVDIESSNAAQVFKDNGQQTTAYEDFFMVVSHPTFKTSDSQFQTTLATLQKELGGFSYEGQPLFSLLVNPYQAPPELKSLSADGSTARIYGRITGDTFSTALVKKLDGLNKKLPEIKSTQAGYNILVYNQTLGFIESNGNTQESLQKSLLFTLVPTFLILLIVFGTFVSAVVPLVLAMTAIMGTTGVILIYSRLSGNTNIADATMLAVLMGLAVAVDYSLFVISRYRLEKQHGHDKMRALEIATGTAGRAVFFSGVLVAIAMSGLLFLGGRLIPISLSIIVVVLLSVLGSITFLPALLSILGKGINWGRIPFFGREKGEGGGIWAAIVGWVMRYPIPVAIVSVALLVALASPLLHIRLGSSLVGDDSLESTKAAKLMLQKWPEGTELRLDVVITNADRPETVAAIEKFRDAALKVPNINNPVASQTSGNGKVIKLSFTQPGSSNDAANMDAVTKLRTEVVPVYFKDLSDVKVYVSGQSAITVDTNRFFTNPIVWIFVLSLSFVVLLVVFRSLAIAIKAITLNLLSTGAAYGVVILVFQDGWLGIEATGFIENFLPVFMFAIIFGLSMDYHLFILTRIKELHDKGLSNNEAVAKGIASTSSLITGAAAIMVIVFGDFFIAIDNTSIQQLGLGLAVAVFLDATIVRTLLLPAAMRLMGEWNWWLPGFLNWLPKVRIELEEEAKSETAPELAEVVTNAPVKMR